MSSINFSIPITGSGGGGGGSSSGTYGSVQFAGFSAGTFSSDSSNLFWNNTTKSLGIGTFLLGNNRLLVSGTFAITGNILPAPTNTYNLGSTSNIWNTVYATNLSGSLTKLSNGTSYLIAGSNISIATGSSGAVTISAPSVAPSTSAFVTIGNDSSLSNERALTAGTGLLLLDGGSNNNVTLAISDSIVATISGSTFTGAVKFNAGLSGSLTTLSDGSPYIVAGSNVQITTGSNGSILISVTSTPGGSGGGFVTASFTNVTSVTVTHNLGIDLYDIEIFDLSRNKIIPKSATATSTTQADITFGIPRSGYVIINGGGASSIAGSGSAGYLAKWDTISSLTNSVVFETTSGIGIGTTIFGSDKLSVNGAVAISGSILPGASTLYNLGSATKIWDNVYSSAFTGSLTKLADGTPYLRAGGNVTITTSSNGSVIISTSLTGYTTASFTNVTSVTVSHNLGLNLYDIEIFDTSYNKIIPKSATATSTTQADITFGIPRSGYVIIGSPNTAGSQPIVTATPDSFTGDGLNPSFTVASGFSQNSILVFVNGSYYHPVEDYTVTGTNLTFTSIPSPGAKIRIRYLTTA